jgi:hypothetical protein
MKTWEIIREAQENGAKIRKKVWDPKSFFVTWNGKNWLGESGKITCISLDELDWEIYEEPKTYFGPDRVMYWLAKGHRVKRKPWMKNLRIMKRDNGFVSFDDGSDCIDWFHADWHLCDENGNYIPEPEEVKG